MANKGSARRIGRYPYLTNCMAYRRLLYGLGRSLQIVHPHCAHVCRSLLSEGLVWLCLKRVSNFCSFPLFSVDKLSRL